MAEEGHGVLQGAGTTGLLLEHDQLSADVRQHDAGDLAFPVVIRAHLKHGFMQCGGGAALLQFNSAGAYQDELVGGFRMDLSSGLAVDSATVVTDPDRYRMSGQVLVAIYAPRASGDAAVLAKATAVQAAFRGWRSADPIIRISSASLVGTSDYGDGWKIGRAHV